MADVVKIEGYDIRDAAAEADILDLETYLGYTDENVIGLLADFENNTFTRLGGAVGKSAGADFNVYNMYGNRKVCAVQDDGTISKWWGEDGYVEDGSIGQIMVRQPKFYYKVVPLKLQKITPEDETQTDVKGYHGLKMAYYISDKPLPGFKLHPAFVNASGEEVDCYYIGSYEGSLWDASENEYRKYDTWDVTDNGDNTYTINSFDAYLADAQNDKLCSIAGVKPASGEYSTQFTRDSINTIAGNRGSGWGQINIKIISAEQLLFVIEYASFNSQLKIEDGVSSYVSGSHNESVFTGSTTSLGNATGAAASSTRLASNSTAYEIDSRNGYRAVRYRGVENFFGNPWSHTEGINIWGNGKMKGGEPYICDDFNYEVNKHTKNYKTAGFSIAYASTYIKYFGYNSGYDWLFIASLASPNATSALPVGDSKLATTNLNGYRMLLIGGPWYGGVTNGYFAQHMANAIASRYKHIGSRLIKV